MLIAYSAGKQAKSRRIRRHNARHHEQRPVSKAQAPRVDKAVRLADGSSHHRTFTLCFAASSAGVSHNGDAGHRKCQHRQHGE